MRILVKIKDTLKPDWIDWGDYKGEYGLAGITHEIGANCLVHIPDEIWRPEMLNVNAVELPVNSLPQNAMQLIGNEMADALGFERRPLK